MTQHVAAHVPDEVYRTWKAEADSMDVSLSKYVKMMAISGRKKFERTVEPDETRADLRKQRNDLRNELRRARNLINELERQLSVTERPDIIEYVEENPGVEQEDIIQHILNTTNGRVTRLLTEMEGAELRIDSKERYYAGDNAGGNDQ